PFEGVDVIGPEPAEGLQPFIDLLKWLTPQPVETLLRVDGRFHETRVTQHPQVLGNGRLRDTQVTLDLADRLLRSGQQAQDRAAVWLGNDFEYRFHVQYIPYKEYTCQDIYCVLRRFFGDHLSR